MARLPRDLSGDALIRRLARLGYFPTRQAGSHVRVTLGATSELPEHHVTIPRHQHLRIGTLSALLQEISDHLRVDREKLIALLFDQNN